MKRLLVLGFALLAVPAAGAGPRPGGEITIAAPLGCPNIWFVCVAQASAAVNQVIEGAFKVGPDLTYRPNLISRARVTEKPFTVTYFIRPQATWNDGEPVSAGDFVFTHRIFTSPKYRAAPDAAPYASIRRVEAVGPKTVRVVFKARYAAWRELFHSVFPEHALSGENLEEVWTEAIDNPKTGEPISDGPFVVSSYVPGEQLTLERNPSYWGAHDAYLDRVAFHQAEDFAAELAELRSGRADAINPQIQSQLVSLRRLSGFTLRTTAGTSFEHLALRLGTHGNPLLRRRFVREAIVFAIDRDALARRLVGALTPSVRPLQNLIFVPNVRWFEPHWSAYRRDAGRVRALLQKNGCRLGSDRVYACGGERLSFRFATTAGNPLRERSFSVLRTQLKDVGIELVPVFATPPVFFRQVLANGDFDLAQFSWVNTPDPGYAVEIWRCGGNENQTGYCNRKVSADLLESNRTLDERKRAALLNRVDTQLALDLPAIPLFQKPTAVAYRKALRGIVDNATEEGWTWNLQDWWIAR